MSEKRVLESAVTLEERADAPKRLVGYAVVYDKRSFLIAGFFVETFARGAFRAHLSTTPDVRALAYHDRARVLGRTTAGTLRLFEDDTGVRFELDLPNTTDGNDVAESVRRRDVTGMSFEFITETDSWSKENGKDLRTVIAAKLVEVSPVAFPAYGDTTVALRSMQDAAAGVESMDRELKLRILKYAL